MTLTKTSWLKFMIFSPTLEMRHFLQKWLDGARTASTTIPQYSNWPLKVDFMNGVFKNI